MILNPHPTRFSEAQLAEEYLAERVRTRLWQSTYLQLRAVSCASRDGVVILTGNVPNYHSKQLAQELALGTTGVAYVRNDVVVTQLAYRSPAGPNGDQ